MLRLTMNWRGVYHSGLFAAGIPGGEVECAVLLWAAHRC